MIYHELILRPPPCICLFDRLIGCRGLICKSVSRLVECRVDVSPLGYKSTEETLRR